MVLTLLNFIFFEFMNYQKYTSAINYRTLISLIISVIATWICYKYNLVFDLDLTLISVAVVFPLVFTLGSAFQRREKALEHLGRAKAALASIKYCFSVSKNIPESELNKIYSIVMDVKTELIKFLYSKSNDKSKLNSSIGLIQKFISKHRDSLGRSLSLRVYRLMRDVIMGIENSISIKVHRTPQSIRAYCELFIYIFPFYYAPTLIQNIDAPGSEEIIYSLPVPTIDNDHAFMVYGLNFIISFILISLFNVQEQIENPYDQDGMDDIKLENYELDY